MDVNKLEGLGSLVDEIDADDPQAKAEEQAKAQAQQQAELDADTKAREWGIVAFTVGRALSMLEPQLLKVYTEDACLDWGRSVVPVAEKYGWDGPGNVPELGLLISTAGLAVPSYLLIRAKLDEIRALRQAAEAAQRQRDQARTVDNGGGDGG